MRLQKNQQASQRAVRPPGKAGGRARRAGGSAAGRDGQPGPCSAPTSVGVLLGKNDFSVPPQAPIANAACRQRCCTQHKLPRSLSLSSNTRHQHLSRGRGPSSSLDRTGTALGRPSRLRAPLAPSRAFRSLITLPPPHMPTPHAHRACRTHLALSPPPRAAHTGRPTAHACRVACCPPTLLLDL